MTEMDRRTVLGLLAGVSLTALGACGSDSGDNADSPATPEPDDGAVGPSAGNADGTTAGETPSETVGPFPADGTNGPNMLTESGIVRSDIRSSIGDASGVAAGVPLRIALTVTDATSGKAMPGAAVYLWQCDALGRYSLYNEGATEENYLRGVQAADANGVLTFTTVFPGDYSGRWPHLHFEVFDKLSEATTGRNARKTSQFALPAAACEKAYASSDYPGSAESFSQESLARDVAFRDGFDLQMATVTGSNAAGYDATLTLAV